MSTVEDIQKVLDDRQLAGLVGRKEDLWFSRRISHPSRMRAWEFTTAAVIAMPMVFVGDVEIQPA